MATIREHDTVVLRRDLPVLGLEAGDVGAVVHIYRGDAAVEVEFVSGSGATVGIETLSMDDVRLIDRGEILHVRALAA